MNLRFPERWRERFLRYAPLFLWIGVIFFLSSSMGAASNTSRFIRPFLEWLFPNASAETITFYHGYVRKFAHFTEYAILAFWAWIAFKGKIPRVGDGAKIPVSRIEGFAQQYWYIVSFLIVAAVASIDEFNQSFNSARTGSGYDVLLDIFGGITMILFIWAIKYFRKN